MNYNCLIVDDEAALSQSTAEYFNMFGVKTHWVADDLSCKEFFRSNTADLILLDINLGDSSGFALCREIRETINVPILFISGRTSDDDMILALNIGGDDYIQKPYSLSVLLAKVNAVLKRQKADNKEENSGAKRLIIDSERRTAMLDNVKLNLKTMEYKLLVYLVKNKNKVVSKEEIFREVWEESITGDNTLNVHIRRLREKIEENPNEPKCIKTAWGVGYIYEETN